MTLGMIEPHVICHTCRRSHPLKCEADPEQKIRDFGYNHQGHKVDVRDLAEWAIDANVVRYAGNADIKIAYVASATITCGVATTPLGTSATFVLGREATALDNGTNKYVDGIVKGKVTVGTGPTTNTQIRVYAFAALDETPTWPDVMDGTDSDETLTSVGVGAGFLKFMAMMNCDSTTSDRVYPFVGWKSLAELFGFMPQDWSIFVTHNTGVALNSTAGNHVFKVDQIYFTVA